MRNLYFITATYGERYFLPKGKLACNYNVLAAPNILRKIYSILFLTYMSLWSLTWHRSAACLLWVFLFMSPHGWFTQQCKRLFKLTCNCEMVVICHLFGIWLYSEFDTGHDMVWIFRYFQILFWLLAQEMLKSVGAQCQKIPGWPSNQHSWPLCFK